MFGWRILGTDVYHLRGLGCSSVGGCVTEAKSHRCIEERTSDVVISAFFRRTGGCSEHVANFLDSGTGFWEFSYAGEPCVARDY